MTGDSRCVLSRKGIAVDLSVDHTPQLEGENSRIVKAGGRVTMDGRVNGGLNLSRAIGDHAYKTVSKTTIPLSCNLPLITLISTEQRIES